MGVAYTPGLRVTGNALIRMERRLPTKGEVLVTEGQMVAADEVVARAEMPGNLHTVRAAQTLHVEPQELEGYLLKRPGNPSIFPLFHAHITADNHKFHRLIIIPVSQKIDHGPPGHRICFVLRA